MPKDIASFHAAAEGAEQQPDKINISLVYRTCTLSDLEAAFFWRATEKWKEKRPYQIVDR